MFVCLHHKSFHIEQGHAPGIEKREIDQWEATEILGFYTF